MNVISLFGGVEVAFQALKELDIKVHKYYTSEVDKYATSVTRYVHPEAIHLGDIRSHSLWNFHGITTNIDLIVAGFPCQDLSIAKHNREGLNGARSGLFWEAIEVLKIYKPKYFLFENVASMKASEKDIITETLGVQPIMINSALVSAQQRKRLYWTNIPNIIQPEDKHIYLQDILEEGFTDRLKAYTITARYWRTATTQNQLDRYYARKQDQIVFETPVRVGNIGESTSQANRIYDVNGKSVTLSANGGGLGAKTGLYCIAQRGRYKKDGSGKTEQQYEPRSDDKTNCLTCVQKDNYVTDGFHIRKLTPGECCELQTLDPNYNEFGIDEKGKEVKISNTQRYRQTGNSFTKDVIKHILRGIK